MGIKVKFIIKIKFKSVSANPISNHNSLYNLCNEFKKTYLNITFKFPLNLQGNKNCLLKCHYVKKTYII